MESSWKSRLKRKREQDIYRGVKEGSNNLTASGKAKSYGAGKREGAVAGEGGFLLLLLAADGGIVTSVSRPQDNDNWSTTHLCLSSLTFRQIQHLLSHFPFPDKCLQNKLKWHGLPIAVESDLPGTWSLFVCIWCCHLRTLSHSWWLLQVTIYITCLLLDWSRCFCVCVCVCVAWPSI